MTRCYYRMNMYIIEIRQKWLRDKVCFLAYLQVGNTFRWNIYLKYLPLFATYVRDIPWLTHVEGKYLYIPDNEYINKSINQMTIYTNSEIISFLAFCLKSFQTIYLLLRRDLRFKMCKWLQVTDCPFPREGNWSKVVYEYVTRYFWGISTEIPLQYRYWFIDHYPYKFISLL